MIRLEPRLDEQHQRHLRRKCHWMALTRVLYGGPSPKKVLPNLDNIRTELKQSIGYTGSMGHLRKDLLHTKSAYTRCGVNQKVLMERQDVVLNRIRYLRMVRELREAGYTDETFVLFLWKRVHSNWQTFNVGRAYYCLLVSLYINVQRKLIFSMY